MENVFPKFDREDENLSRKMTLSLFYIGLERHFIISIDICAHDCVGH
jgi:hypothetical protein